MDDDVRVPPERTRAWSAFGETRHVVLDGGHWDFLDGPDALQAEVARDMASIHAVDQGSRS